MAQRGERARARPEHGAGGPSEGSYAGVGAAAVTGRAIFFDAAGRGDSSSDAEAESGAWHAPCLVMGPSEKWSLTFFKTPAPLWPISGMLAN